jgi:CubicO group peptidase (beta-lactamase class C family)
MKKAIAISLITLLLNSVCIFAQADTSGMQKEFSTAYEAYIQKTMEQLPDIPAIAVVVVKDDKPIFVRAYGLADREAGTRADADTLFYIASSTKSFTAMSAALLDREGKIKLDDPMVKYSSGITFKNPLPEKITVRDLLIHTSGLRNEPLVFRMAFSGESEPADMRKVFGEATTFIEANYGKYRYDNMGYNIYGVLLENHLKLKWQDLLEDKIFDPLGMKYTTAYISRARARKWKVAAPYIFDPVAGKTIRAPLAKTDSNMQSAGGMFTSANDIGRWLNMNMNEGKLNGKQIIPAEIVRAAHTGYTQVTRSNEPFTGEGQYGLGWQIGKYRNETVIYHHGGFPGYASHVSYLPEKKIAIAVLVNGDIAAAKSGHILATYGYDWWLQTPDLHQTYEKQLSDTVTRYTEWKTARQTDAANRAKRTSRLTQPVANYAGTYRNEIFGTIEITALGNGLAVRMGNMNAVSTPFTEKETIRVELMPGQGEVIKFVPNAEGKFASIMYGKIPFERIAR